MHEPQESDRSSALASTRTMEIVVALVLAMGAAVVIFDSVRLGVGWRDDGPAPGFFPFWVAAILGGATLVNLVKALRDRLGAGEAFVTRSTAGRVMAVLVPLFLYVLAVQFLGIYVSSAGFILGFMTLIGKEKILKSALIGVSVSLALFVLFERWFLVPLPKGPFEVLLGLG